MANKEKKVSIVMLVIDTDKNAPEIKIMGDEPEIPQIFSAFQALQNQIVNSLIASNLFLQEKLNSTEE